MGSFPLLSSHSLALVFTGVGFPFALLFIHTLSLMLREFRAATPSTKPFQIPLTYREKFHTSGLLLQCQCPQMNAQVVRRWCRMRRWSPQACLMSEWDLTPRPRRRTVQSVGASWSLPRRASCAARVRYGCVSAQNLSREQAEGGRINGVGRAAHEAAGGRVPLALARQRGAR